MRVIYVDDENTLLENFRLTVEGIARVDSLNLFRKSEEVLKWVEENPVDVAFLDIEMPVMNGIELAKRLKQIDENIRIVFVTAFDQYALQAFGVEAIGYLLKPYSQEDVARELEKAFYIRPRPKKRIEIQTMPDLLITVDGETVSLGQTKQKELLAFLIDRGDIGISSGEAIACLWGGKASSDSLFRVTFSRLKDCLKEVGIDHIVVSEGKKKWIRTEQVECDLYQMLAGDAEAIKKYSGEYLRQYSWAEYRNAQLNEIKWNFQEDAKL
ncbi:MAG: response regulator [Lachnospiraceae bacterium]|nr:response regulator [Lachnospiraceae bacterium]